MPLDQLLPTRKNTVKAPLTPQTPGDWLLSQFERRLGQHRTKGVIYNPEGDRSVHIQPMLSFKALVTVDPDERMDTGPDDYDDQLRWWL